MKTIIMADGSAIDIRKEHNIPDNFNVVTSVGSSGELTIYRTRMDHYDSLPEPIAHYSAGLWSRVE